MCYSGMYIKENFTIDDFKKIIDDCYNGVLWMRNHEEDMRIQYEKYRKEYEERLLNGESGSGINGFGWTGSSKDYIIHTAHEVYSVRSYYPNIKFPKNWIIMWKEKFKNEPEMLSAFENRVEILPKIEKLRLERVEKLIKLDECITT